MFVIAFPDSLIEEPFKPPHRTKMKQIRVKRQYWVVTWIHSHKTETQLWKKTELNYEIYNLKSLNKNKDV